MTFSVLDVVFVSLIGLLMIRAYLKGFVAEILSMAAIVFGFYAAVFFYKNGAAFLRSEFWPDLQAIPEIVSFVALFLIVLIIAKILARMLTNIINSVSLTGANSFLGLVFGFFEGIILVSLIIIALNITKPFIDTSEFLKDSFFARLLSPLIFGRENLLQIEVPNV